MSATILVGDCREHMAAMEPNSVDAIVTDPPYDLTANKKGGSGVASVNLNTPHGRARIGTGNGAGGFMGMAWDGTGIAFDPETWSAAKRVLKPGGYLLAFGGTRTFHRMTVAIEDAGFEVKDCLSWLYGSGFPKHKSLLKPAWEPIVLAKKRGAGMLNVDGCRLGGEPWTRNNRGTALGLMNDDGWQPKVMDGASHELGRWPANVVLDEDAAAMLDAQSGERPGGGKVTGDESSYTGETGIYGVFGRVENSPYGDTGGASRFFYVAKADRSERDKGLEGLPRRMIRWSAGDQNPGSFQSDGTDKTARNFHPTVKPVALMQWLVRLVTPKGGTVLDPFMGSGTTGIACDREGFNFIGIELSSEYAEIARKRITGDAPMFADVSVA